MVPPPVLSTQLSRNCNWTQILGCTGQHWRLSKSWTPVINIAFWLPVDAVLRGSQLAPQPGYTFAVSLWSTPWTACDGFVRKALLKVMVSFPFLSHHSLPYWKWWEKTSRFFWGRKEKMRGCPHMGLLCDASYSKECGNQSISVLAKSLTLHLHFSTLQAATL